MRCNECGKVCKTLSTLRQDTYSHTQGKKYKCKHCQETFTFKSYLKVHLIKHSSRAMYKCSIVNCDKRFKHKGELVRHSWEHKNKAWICKVCRYEMNTECKLKQYMNMYTQRKQYKCKYCEEMFVQTMQLVGHYPKCTKNPAYAD